MDKTKQHWLALTLFGVKVNVDHMACS